MKRYTASIEHVPEHPERTAYKQGHGMDFDVYFQVWPSAAAMKKSIQMQGSRAPRADDWRPWITSRGGQKFLAEKLPSSTPTGTYAGLEGSGPGGSHVHSLHCIESGPHGLFCRVTGEGA